MAAPLTSDRLAGLAEVAALLGVSKQRVNQLRKAPGFPEPVALLTCGPIWDAAEVRRWDEYRKLGPGAAAANAADVAASDREREREGR